MARVRGVATEAVGPLHAGSNNATFYPLCLCPPHRRAQGHGSRSNVALPRREEPLEVEGRRCGTAWSADQH